MVVCVFVCAGYSCVQTTRRGSPRVYWGGKADGIEGGSLRAGRGIDRRWLEEGARGYNHQDSFSWLPIALRALRAVLSTMPPSCVYSESS